MRLVFDTSPIAAVTEVFTALQINTVRQLRQAIVTLDIKALSEPAPFTLT